MNSQNQTKQLFQWFVVMLLGFGLVGAIMTSYSPVPKEHSTIPVADGFIFTTLYTGFFLCFFGLSALFGYFLRYKHDKALHHSHHLPTLRQAGLLALGLTALLALRGLHVLSWWDGLLLIISLLLVEISFHTKQIT